MGIQKNLDRTADNGTQWTQISIYGDEIDNPGIYTDDNVASTDYLNDHTTDTGSSQWDNQILTGLKLRFYDALNRILKIFGTEITNGSSSVGDGDEEEEEEEIDLTEAIPTHIDDPANDGDIPDADYYNNFWALFQKFLEDDYLGTVPDLFEPYATFVNDSATYFAGIGAKLTKEQYSLWNEQSKYLQHIICKNLTSYVNGGFINGNYSDDGCSNGLKSNGKKSNGYNSYINNTNGNYTNGISDCYKGNYHISWNNSNGSLTNGLKENLKKSNDSHSNGTKVNSTCYEGVEDDGHCGAQGPRYINVLCQKRTCAQTCTTYATSGVNYSIEEVEQFLNS